MHAEDSLTARYMQVAKKEQGWQMLALCCCALLTQDETDTDRQMLQHSTNRTMQRLQLSADSSGHNRVASMGSCQMLTFCVFFATASRCHTSKPLASSSHQHVHRPTAPINH
jgi:hypothetical protein